MRSTQQTGVLNQVSRYAKGEDSSKNRWRKCDIEDAQHEIADPSSGKRFMLSLGKETFKKHDGRYRYNQYGRLIPKEIRVHEGVGKNKTSPAGSRSVRSK